MSADTKWGIARVTAFAAAALLAYITYRSGEGLSNWWEGSGLLALGV